MDPDTSSTNTIDQENENDDILTSSDERPTYKVEFTSDVARMLTGSTHTDAEQIIDYVNVSDMNAGEIRTLLNSIGNISGAAAQRHALICILLEKGDLKPDLLSEMLDHSDVPVIVDNYDSTDT